MDLPYRRIGFGGGCHWCTEAYFLHLRGVNIVEQGWIGSDPPHENLSEGVIVWYGGLLKPCEMPAEDAIDFLEQSILPDLVSSNISPLPARNESDSSIFIDK